jgi:hypothetical protein
MQRLVLYALALFLFFCSWWLGVWLFGVMAVLILAAFGYGYAGACVACVSDLIWGAPTGILHYLGMPLVVLVFAITLLRALAMPLLRSRVPSSI